jgi:hypothetical protein
MMGSAARRYAVIYAVCCVQSHYECVVADQDEQRCRNALYDPLIMLRTVCCVLCAVCCVQAHYECVVVDEDEQHCRNALYKRAAGPNVGRAVHVAGRSWSRSGDAVQARNYFDDRCGAFTAVGGGMGDVYL